MIKELEQIMKLMHLNITIFSCNQSLKTLLTLMSFLMDILLITWVRRKSNELQKKFAFFYAGIGICLSQNLSQLSASVCFARGVFSILSCLLLNHLNILVNLLHISVWLSCLSLKLHGSQHLLSLWCLIELLFFAVKCLIFINLCYHDNNLEWIQCHNSVVMFCNIVHIYLWRSQLSRPDDN